MLVSLAIPHQYMPKPRIKPLYYIAYEEAKLLASAILVPKDSKITKLNELKGKRIALQKGSSAHYLLVQAVRKAGLQWSGHSTDLVNPC